MVICDLYIVVVDDNFMCVNVLYKCVQCVASNAVNVDVTLACF